MINKSKSKKHLKMIIIGILIINIIAGFQALLVDNAPIENVSLENISPIDAGSGVISILETTPYGGIYASGWDHNEHEYYELNIVTNFGPGLTWYMMNDSEYLYNIGLDRNSRTRGNFPYTELLSDVELSASCVFYPLYSDKWYVVAINHYEFTASEIEFTDSWEDDFITVDNPTDSSSWEVNTSQYVNWTWGGNFDLVDIALYHDGTFLSQIAINTPNDGSYSWRIPTNILLFDDLYQVNISNSDFADTWGISDSYFEILEIKSINLVNPTSSSSWETNTTHLITWTSTGSITDVKIEMFEDDVFEMEIIASTPDDGEFSWIIPSGLDNSTQYQIKITDVSDPLINIYGDYFEIYTNPSPSESNNIPGYDLMILYVLSITSLLGISIRVISSLRKKIRTSEGI